MRGAQIAREAKCDIIVALGGGSTMDASKVIAAAVLYEGDPWDMIFHGQEHVHIPTRALPVVTVPTLAATGSEMNCGAINDLNCALQGIDRFEDFLKSIGCPTRLSELNIDDTLRTLIPESSAKMPTSWRLNQRNCSSFRVPGMSTCTTGWTSFPGTSSPLFSKIT